MLFLSTFGIIICFVFYIIYVFSIISQLLYMYLYKNPSEIPFLASIQKGNKKLSPDAILWTFISLIHLLPTRLKPQEYSWVPISTRFILILHFRLFSYLVACIWRE